MANQASLAETAYVRGMLAEFLDDTITALEHYKRALEYDPAHGEAGTAIIRLETIRQQQT